MASGSVLTKRMSDGNPIGAGKADIDSGAGSRRTVVQAAKVNTLNRRNKRIVFKIEQPVADINYSCELLLQCFKQICDFPC